MTGVRLGNGINFADLWETLAANHPDFEAQVQGERTFTWRKFDRRADGVAFSLLDAGLGAQAKVGQYLYNCPEYLESMFGIFKAGMVPVNTNYRYGDDEVAYLWSDADVEAVLFDRDFVDVCERLRPRLPQVKLWIEVSRTGDGPAADWSIGYEEAAASARRTIRAPWGRSGQDLYLLYTGGTTGMPKGVMWQQDRLFRFFEAQAGRVHPHDATAESVAAQTNRPGPRVLPAPPLMHGSGAWFAMAALSLAGTVVTSTETRFRATTVLKEVAEHRVGGMVIIGDSFARPLLGALDDGVDLDLSRWKFLQSSGAMFCREIKEGLLSHLPHLVIVDELGSSETGSIARSAAKSGDAADPTATFQLKAHSKVFDDAGREMAAGSAGIGRLAVTGNIPIGYYKDSAKTAQTFVRIGSETYVYTGDWVEMSAGGGVRLLGRGSGCINTGGEKVFAEEVETVVKTLPDVVDAVVVGVPDDRFGQAVTAIVQLSPGSSLTTEQVVGHVRAHLAAYKAPKHVVVVESVGRAANGKVDHKGLGLLARDRLGIPAPV